MITGGDLQQTGVTLLYIYSTTTATEFLYFGNGIRCDFFAAAIFRSKQWPDQHQCENY